MTRSGSATAGARSNVASMMYCCLIFHSLLEWKHEGEQISPMCRRLDPLVSRFHHKNTFIQCFNSGPASQTVHGPVLNQYCVFGMDSWNLLNATIKITVAILFKHRMLNQCCFNVGLASRIVIQPEVNRETSRCVYWALWMRFHLTNRYIYIYLFKSEKAQWGLLKFEVWSSKSEV